MIVWTIILYTAAAAVIFGLSSPGLKTGFRLHMTQTRARVIFRALITYLAQMTGLLWLSTDNFHRVMQPFVGMHPIPGMADENILLDYPCCPPIIVSIKAAMKGHWKVAYFSLLSLARNLFPILVGALFIVFPTSTGVIVVTNLPTFYGVALFVFIYCISLPIAWPRRKRKCLPRPFAGLVDLISYSYHSSLLNDPNSLFNLDKKTDTRKHMECRLFLAEKRYCFTDDKAGGGQHVGIDVLGEKGE
jgi:hypothetical protein